MLSFPLLLRVISAGSIQLLSILPLSFLHGLFFKCWYPHTHDPFSQTLCSPLRNFSHAHEFIYILSIQISLYGMELHFEL